ncbi:MAG: hypothetical protein WAW37_18175 [Syntrophobacteraceae bacterium]
MQTPYDAQNILQSSILYYPTIEFLDETWVKSTLCIWERIYRIVPSSYTPNDSDEIKDAINAGLILDLKLSDEDLSKTAQLFNLFWERVPVIPLGIEGFDELEVRLHPDKVDARILPLLQSLAKQIDPNGFLNLSSQVANTYMLFLAETVARRRRLAKLTDDPDMFSIMNYFAHNGNFNEYIYNTECNEVTASIAMPMLLPGGLKYVNMNKVIEFRDRFTEERMAFRESVIRLVDELKNVEDRDYVREILRQHEKGLLKNQASMLKSISQGMKDAACAVLSVGLPTTLSAMSLLALGSNDPFNLIQISKSAFIGAIASIADTLRSRRKGWRSEAGMYYLQLKNVFRSGDQIEFRTPAFHRALEEFIND